MLKKFQGLILVCLGLFLIFYSQANLELIGWLICISMFVSGARSLYQAYKAKGQDVPLIKYGEAASNIFFAFYTIYQGHLAISKQLSVAIGWNIGITGGLEIWEAFLKRSDKKASQALLISGGLKVLAGVGLNLIPLLTGMIALHILSLALVLQGLALALSDRLLFSTILDTIRKELKNGNV